MPVSAGTGTERHSPHTWKATRRSRDHFSLNADDAMTDDAMTDDSTPDDLTPATIHIRPATPDDAPAISSVLLAAFVEFRPLYTDAGFAATTPDAEQVLTRMSEGQAWVAFRGETIGAEIVGTVTAVPKDDSIYMRGMAVLPAARGAGVGAKLLAEVERYALSLDHRRIFLRTTPFLHGAIALYERSGFRRVPAGATDLFGTPLLTMEKILSSPAHPNCNP